MLVKVLSYFVFKFKSWDGIMLFFATFVIFGTQSPCKLVGSVLFIYFLKFYLIFVLLYLGKWGIRG